MTPPIAELPADSQAASPLWPGGADPCSPPSPPQSVSQRPLAAQVLAALPSDAPAAGLLRTLPEPSRDAGLPLMRALAERRSSRQYAPAALSEQQLADLLWAACGINRPGEERTVPYWRHPAGVDLYAAMADGLWLYEPRLHALRRHLGADLRALTGIQDFVGAAPLELVYVVRGERMAELTPEERRLYGSVDAAFAGQNVYLCCASQGLGCVFRAALDAPRLGRAMQLGEGQFVVFAQTVGHLPDRPAAAGAELPAGAGRGEAEGAGAERSGGLLPAVGQARHSGCSA